MSARDFAECALGAVFQVAWWWIWYGIVVAFMGNGWGFALVLCMVFINNVWKLENRRRKQ